MAQAILTQRDRRADALEFGRHLVEAAIFTGVYQLALDTYPTMWQRGITLIQEGNDATGYAILLTCLSQTFDATETLARCLAQTIRGIL